MNLTFLAPLFLAGAAALAVPIIIHLVHKQKPQGVPFPSLMFLRQIPHKAERRQKIRHWFLFLLRSLAFVLLVLAFSRPLFEGPGDQAGLFDGGTETVVLVDRSFSMGIGNVWESARGAARDVLAATGPEDRVSLVFFDEMAVAVGQPTTDVLALQNAVDRAELGSGTTRFGPALKLAERVFDESDLPGRELIIISDFQRSGWSLDDEVRFSESVRVRPVDVSDASRANAAVAALTLRQEARGEREQLIVSARIVNNGEETLTDLPVQLELNGLEIEAKRETIEAGGTVNAIFEPALLADGESRGVVRIGQDRLTHDDAYHFVVAPGTGISVLVLESSTSRENQSLFVTRALQVGTQPEFRVASKPLRSFRISDLTGRSLVILNDAPFPTGDAGSALRDFVAAGGGLWIGLGDRSGARWPQAFDDILPGTLGPRVDRALTRGGALTAADYGHPALEIFAAPRSGDLSAARFFRYRSLTPSADDLVLARFDDGVPALTERRVGEGRVMTWGSTFDTYWNDLALQPVFVPLMHQLARHLAGYAEAPPQVRVGTVTDLNTYIAERAEDSAVHEALLAGGTLLVEDPAGERTRLTGNETTLFVPGGPGFFTLLPDDDREATPVVLAANVDATESNLEPMDIEEFVGAVSAAGSESSTVVAGATLLSPEEREKRQGVWWYLIVLALVIFAIETGVSNRLSRVAK